MSMWTSSRMYTFVRPACPAPPGRSGRACRRRRCWRRRRAPGASRPCRPSSMATQVSHTPHGSPSTGLLAVEDLGQDAGGRGLARATGAAEQVGVADAVLAHGVAQGPVTWSWPRTSPKRCGPVAAVERLVGHAADLADRTRRCSRADGPTELSARSQGDGQAICGTRGSAESCCLPALTRFTGCDCTGPDRHLRSRRERVCIRVRSLGGVRERPNRHAWKACVGQPTVGSNPTPSARGPTGRSAGNASSGRTAPAPPGSARSGRVGENHPALISMIRQSRGASSCLGYRGHVPMSEPLDHDALMAAGARRGPAAAAGEVPVGAVVVVDGRVVARAHNRRESTHDPIGARRTAGAAAACGAAGRGDCPVRRSWSRSSPAPCAPAPCRRPGSTGWCSGPPIPRRARSVRSTTSASIPACPTSSTSSPAVEADRCGALLESFFAGRREPGAPMTSPTEGLSTDHSAAGRSNVNVEPSPSVLSRVRWPACSWA